MRRRSRLARTMLRGMLMIVGVLGVWGVYDAIADEAAHAVAPPRPCLLGGLLNGAGTILGSSLPCTPSSPAGSTVDGGPARIDGAGDATAAPRTTDRSRPPARTERPISVRVPTGERSAKVPAPVRRVVDATAATGVERVVEATEPVTRRVVDVASPVVRESAGAGLLEPVGVVVRPVQPIVEALVPALAPVLDLVQPIIGPPAPPLPPPGDPVDVAPAPAEEAPAATRPATIARPAPAPARAIVGSYPDSSPPAPTWEQTVGGGPSADAAEVDHLPRDAEPAHTPRVAPGAPDSTAGNGSAGGWAGSSADASLGSWTPDLQPQGSFVARCDELADRSDQPGARPA